MKTSEKSWLLEKLMWRGKPSYCIHIKARGKILLTVEISEQEYYELLKSTSQRS